jgi:hypothetical protein
MTNKFVRVMLTFVNPHTNDLKNLQSVLRESLTLSESRLYVSSPANKLIHYSTEAKESVKALIQLKHDTLKPDPNAIRRVNIYD